MLNRRTLLANACIMAATRLKADAAIAASSGTEAAPGHLELSQFEPKSMLRVPESYVARAKYPVIDFHTHVTRSKHAENGVPLASERIYLATPMELLEVMNKKNIQAMVNLTGGYGEGLRLNVAQYDHAFPDRFYTFTEPSYSLWQQPEYPKLQAQAIHDAYSQGARGLKILKTLGLYLRRDVTTGPLVQVDDRRFDSMWDTCGQLGIPVAIHVADPLAFFQPTNRFNERYEELSRHPDWSFYGRDFPSVADLLSARNRVFVRHPNTQFVVLHVGNNAENLAAVAENLDRFPNMSVDVAARIGELGRQPRFARRFFDRYQDRVLFGTDATPHGDETPQQTFNELLYEIYYRFLETEDEYFDYAPSHVPPQGRWRISGINLPDAILRKVYFENAARQLKLDPLRG